MIEEDKDRDELTFEEHLKELTRAILCDNAFHNTPKPE